MLGSGFRDSGFRDLGFKSLNLGFSPKMPWLSKVETGFG